MFWPRHFQMLFVRPVGDTGGIVTEIEARRERWSIVGVELS